MRLFLAGGESRHWIHDELLEIQKKKRNERKNATLPCGSERNAQDHRQCYCISPGYGRGVRGGYDSSVSRYRPYILESFYYADEDTERLLPYFGDFLLDSGAFTFMQGSHGKPIDWNDYVNKYAAFIRKNKIEKFFELDIDSIVGYEAVLKLRQQLESLTGKRCIPVWHKSRGKEEFMKMCDEYDYVAIGGIVSKEIKPPDYWIFTYLINEAHKRGCKIHGLGFTNLAGMKKYHFDSVDSTSWTIGNRFGKIYKFNGQTMIHYDKPKGARLADSRAVALNNFVEWIKFQKYAEVHL